MPRHFTHYWANQTWKDHARTATTGELLDHAASNQFAERGVSAGDSVYIVTVFGGVLHLLTRIEVDLVGDAEAAAARLGCAAADLWDASDHIAARAAVGMDFERDVAPGVAARLRFVTPAGPAPLKWRVQDVIDQQTLRGVRELTPASAHLLDALLPPAQPLHLDQRLEFLAALPNETPSGHTYMEGAVTQVTVNAYERNARARAACIAHWGLDCVVCGFNFAETYGPAGRGYIHVHHLRPLASIGAAYVLDPVADLRPVCPNCHAVMHLRAEEPYGVEEVRRMMAEAAG